VRYWTTNNPQLTQDNDWHKIITKFCIEWYWNNVLFVVRTPHELNNSTTDKLRLAASGGDVSHIRQLLTANYTSAFESDAVSFITCNVSCFVCSQFRVAAWCCRTDFAEYQKNELNWIGFLLALFTGISVFDCVLSMLSITLSNFLIRCSFVTIANWKKNSLYLITALLLHLSPCTHTHIHTHTWLLDL